MAEQQQELEQRIARLTAEREALQRELDAFAHSVSHDLRTPLRHLAGFSDLLLARIDAKTDPETRHYLEIISSAAARMSEMLEKLVVMVRMERQELRPAPVALGPLVEETIRLLKPELGGRQVQWRIGPLPDVSADRAQLGTALRNLLSNAVKFSAGRSPAIVEISAHSSAGEHRISVHDNGVGFDMQFADRLFGIFQRLHPQEDFGGVGIGLAHAQRIFTRHGGRIWAEAALDAGATFHFTLPGVRTP